MTSSKVTISDLPNEILLSIIGCEISPIDPHAYIDFPEHQQYCRYLELSLTCKAFYYALKPIIWRVVRDPFMQNFDKFYASVRTNTDNAKLVHMLGLHASGECWNHDMKVIEGRDPRLHKDNASEALSQRDHFHYVVGKLTNLRFLEVSFQIPSGVIDFMSLHLAETLEELLLTHCDVSPLEFDRLLGLKSLKKLRLMLEFDMPSWSTELPTTKTNATALYLRGPWPNRARPANSGSTWGIPNRIIKSFLLCFRAIESLDVWICKDTFHEGELDSMLISLAETTRLKSIHLEAPVPFETRRLRIDFSMFQYLEKLWIDAVILWPVRDSWKIREELYKVLPKSLKSLRIRFPSMLGIEYGLAPYDGIFQSNVRKSDGGGHRFKDIPEGRFNWFLNLLQTRTDVSGASTPYLPNLERVRLEEDKCYSENTAGLWPSSDPWWSVPEEVTQRFSDRGIKILIITVNWETGWDGGLWEYVEGWGDVYYDY